MEGLRIAGLAVCLIGFVITLIVAARNRSRAWYAIAAWLFLGHLGLFYAVRILDLQTFLVFPLSVENLNIWSTAIHIQAALTFTIITLPMLMGQKFGEFNNA
jgi:hypothetical protein